jgi:hypothetical protein
VPVAGNGGSKPAAWPDACKMLSLDELKALLPGTTAFRREGGHFLGGGNTLHNALCDYSLPAPTTRRAPRATAVDDPGRAARRRRPRAVKQQWAQEQATQAKIAKKFPDQYALYRGPAQCSWDGNELQCIADKWAFWVRGRFVDKTGDDATPLQNVYRKNVLLRVANGLAARMHWPASVGGYGAAEICR